jgi:hypothetical protein
MRSLQLTMAVLLIVCNTSLAQVSTTGTTAMGLPSTPSGSPAALGRQLAQSR